jgi:hypothetical protein
MAGCATTGDPRQGGLFGWSEAKARDRQDERQSRVAGAEAELNGENARSRSLAANDVSAEQHLTAAQLANDRAEEKLRAQQAAIVAKTERLENESPTPAGASRARAYRRKVNTVAAQAALPNAQRRARLHTLEAEIDAALEQLKR